MAPAVAPLFRSRWRHGLLLVLGLAAGLHPASVRADESSAGADDETAQTQEKWQQAQWSWGGVPAINYNSDEGFGLGVLGSVYRYDGRTNPYKWSSTLLVFFTTRSVQTHRLDFDLLDIGNTGLRLRTRIALDVTRTGNYCGVGPAVTCDPAEATAAADALGLGDPEARATFLRRYYLLRWVRPYAYVNTRYRIGRWTPKTEALLGWSGSHYQAGDFKARGPYSGSRYDEDFGPTGEGGFTSVLQAGLMVDTRDNEAAPRRGQWHELTLRGADRWLGSDFRFFGVNATLRFYQPLLGDDLTLAARTVFDGIWGKQHVRDLASVGGSTIYSFGGGDQAGRGIRLRRYIGRLKAMQQISLRWAFWRPTFLGSTWELTWLAFLDVLAVAEDGSQIGAALTHPLAGGGTGLRAAPEPNFVIRLDVGFSSVERWSPGVYLDVGHLF